MDRGYEQTFYQRRYTDNQEAHEKMFNVTNYQGNANQNYNEISPYTCQNGYNYQDKKQQMLDVEKREPSYTAGGNANCCSHYGKQYGDFAKN